MIYLPGLAFTLAAHFTVGSASPAPASIAKRRTYADLGADGSPQVGACSRKYSSSPPNDLTKEECRWFTSLPDNGYHNFGINAHSMIMANMPQDRDITCYFFYSGGTLDSCGRTYFPVYWIAQPGFFQTSRTSDIAFDAVRCVKDIYGKTDSCSGPA